MKTYKFNGELWYVDDRPLWCLIRRWFACVGMRELKNGRLSDEGAITPLGLFGHRINFYGHWFDVRTPWGILVVVFKRDEHGRLVRRGLKLEVERAYLSPNGTPGFAHTWFVGAPPELVRHVEKRPVA